MANFSKASNVVQEKYNLYVLTAANVPGSAALEEEPWSGLRPGCGGQWTSPPARPATSAARGLVHGVPRARPPGANVT